MKKDETYLIKSGGVAVHGVLLPLIDARDDALLVHGQQLPLLRLALLLQGLDRLLEPIQKKVFIFYN